MQQTRPEETALDLHGRECDKNDVLMVSRITVFMLVTVQSYCNYLANFVAARFAVVLNRIALHSFARSLTATHRRTGVIVRHGLLRTARSLASSPLDRSLSTRSLARSPLARSLSGCRTATHRYTGVTPARATAETSPANCNCHVNAA